MAKTKKSERQLIVQALNAAETNIKLAKQLLSGVKAEPQRSSPKDLPGIVGVFDGENMVAEDGKKYLVNPNYASKSVLVYGDTLKRIEEDGEEKFKQIKRVKRQKVEGILAKKDGQWVAVTADGSYRVSPVAVEFHRGKEGDEVVVVLPLNDKTVPYAALEKVLKEEPLKKEKPEERKKAEGESQRTQKKAEGTEKKGTKKTKKRGAKKETKATTSNQPEANQPGAEVPPEAEVENDEELR